MNLRDYEFWWTKETVYLYSELKVRSNTTYVFSLLQRTANALRALSRMGNLSGLMSGKGGTAGGAAARNHDSKAASKEANETAGDSLAPARLAPNFSTRNRPALCGRRSPMSRVEARKYSTPEPRN